MDSLSKRQQKTIAKLVKQEEIKNPHAYVPPEKVNKTSRWSALKHVVLVLLVLGGIFWLKSGESWYDEVVSTADSLEFDPYLTLKVAKQADSKTIKQQFRKLSLEWHPDKRESCDDDCKKTFERINESYKILSNPSKRKLYDTTARVFSKSDSDFNNDMHPFEFSYSPELWDTIVKPSLEGRQLGMAKHISGVWLIFIGNSATSKVTEHILPLWSDLAAQFYGRVSFLRIDADAYPEFESRMPIRVRVRPAFLMLSSTDAPLFFSDMINFSPQVLSQWITESVPNPFQVWTGSDEALAKYLLQYNATKEDGSVRRIPIAVISKNLHSTLVRTHAARTLSTIEWIQPPSSRFMDYMGSTVKKQVANIKDGAAICSSISGEAYVKVIGAKAAKLDVTNRQRTKSENIDDTAPGKYLNLFINLTNKIIGGNAPPCYRENAPMLCGLSNENKYCNVMRAGAVRSAAVTHWSQDNNATVQDVFLPPKHKSSVLSRLLSDSTTESVLLQLKHEKLAPVAKSGIGEWQAAYNNHKFFPTYRLGPFQEFYKWIKANPLPFLGLLSGMTVVVVVGLVIRHYFRTKAEDKKI